MLYRKQATRNPTQSKFSANTLLIILMVALHGTSHKKSTYYIVETKAQALAPRRQSAREVTILSLLLTHEWYNALEQNVGGLWRDK